MKIPETFVTKIVQEYLSGLFRFYDRISIPINGFANSNDITTLV